MGRLRLSAAVQDAVRFVYVHGSPLDRARVSHQVKGNCWNEACIRLLDLQNEDGGLSARGRRSGIEDTAHALPILMEMRVTPVLSRAVTFLLREQGEDGSWRERARRADPSPLADDRDRLTALVSASLHSVGGEPNGRAMAHLLSRGALDLGNGGSIAAVSCLIPSIRESGGEGQLRLVERGLRERIDGRELRVEEAIPALRCLSELGCSTAERRTADLIHVLLMQQCDEGAWCVEGRQSLSLTAEALCALVPLLRAREMPRLPTAGARRPFGLQYSYSNDELLESRLRAMRH